MALPASFAREGFTLAKDARNATRRRLPSGKLLKPILIGTEGETNTGKTEFIFSCPGPGLMIAIDRSFEAALDNPHPPVARNPDWAIKVIKVPPNLTALQPTYLSYYTEIRETFYKALENPDAISIAIDCDSDFWELQRLADFGKLANVWPQTRYGDTYAAKRAQIARAWDSGKIVIGSNKVRDEFENVYNADGTLVMESDGKTEKKIKTGRKVRQGFPDTDYLWSVQIRHIYKDSYFNDHIKKQIPMRWGIQIIKCKHRPELKGEELWGADANFRGLVTLIYPEVPIEEWGLKK